MITRAHVSSHDGLALTHAVDRRLFLRLDLGRMCAFGADYLPFGKTAIERRDTSIVKDPHTIGERAEERAVVTDNDHAAIVALDGILQRLDRLDVQMVRWLVENEQVRARQHHHRERHARALPTGQGICTPLDFVAGKPKAAEMSPNLPALPRRPQIRYHVIQPAISRHLSEVLTIVGNSD